METGSWKMELQAIHMKGTLLRDTVLPCTQETDTEVLCAAEQNPAAGEGREWGVKDTVSLSLVQSDIFVKIRFLHIKAQVKTQHTPQQRVLRAAGSPWVLLHKTQTWSSSSITHHLHPASHNASSSRRQSCSSTSATHLAWNDSHSEGDRALE